MSVTWWRSGLACPDEDREVSIQDPPKINTTSIDFARGVIWGGLVAVAAPKEKEKNERNKKKSKKRKKEGNYE